MLWYRGLEASGGYGAASLIRISLILAAAWLAWPSLKRPASWLPPGIAAITLIAIGACAVQPKLAIALVPIVGGLITFAGFLRFFRGR